VRLLIRASPRTSILFAFLIDPIGPGTRALAALEAGDAIHVLGPLGNGFSLDVERPLLVGGGIGVAPFPYLSARLGGSVARMEGNFQTAHPQPKG